MGDFFSWQSPKYIATNVFARYTGTYTKTEKLDCIPRKYFNTPTSAFLFLCSRCETVQAYCKTGILFSFIFAIFHKDQLKLKQICPILYGYTCIGETEGWRMPHGANLFWKATGWTFHGAKISSFKVLDFYVRPFICPFRILVYLTSQ